MTEKPTPQILRELGFDVRITCNSCHIQLEIKADSKLECCGGKDFDVRFKEAHDNEWLTEDDAISRIETDGRSEEFFNSEMRL